MMDPEKNTGMLRAIWDLDREPIAKCGMTIFKMVSS